MPMSATTRRLPLAEATAIADELAELLRPACERLEIAGSIRRRVPQVGDVDILVVPKMVPLLDMFDQPIGELDAPGHLLDELCGQQAIRQWRGARNQPCWGKDLRRFIFRDLDVQVQSVRDAGTWGMWLVIRTGPSGFSHALVTPRGQKAAIRRRDGSIVEYRQGMLPPGFEIKDSFRLYRFGGLVATPEESDVFDALGLPYIRPEDRL
jgi:hypothetical protein